jgi:KDO2-lipid IV(A) lauroyltransferase
VKLTLNFLGHVFLWLLAIIPYTWVVAFGSLMGLFAPYFATSRAKIVDANLRACFPNLSEDERKNIAKQHWKLLGRSLAERGRLWLGSEQSIHEFVKVTSDVDLTDGKPRLYVGLHMVGIEAGLIALTMHLKNLGVDPGITLYVFMRNTYFEPRIKSWRERFGARMLLRQHNVRELIREIRKGTFVLISPDMDLGKKDSEFVPFFGFPTNTVLSVPRLSKMAGAEVCPVFTLLSEDKKTYECHVGKPWPSYPTDDPVADAAQMNAYFEKVIEPRIAEYFWVHKRFKNRPEGDPSIY